MKTSSFVVRESPIPAKDGVPLKLLWSRGTVQARPLPPACHTDLELQFVRRGRGSYSIAGRLAPFEPNTLLVIRPDEPHYYVFDEPVYREKCLLMINPRWAGYRGKAFRNWPNRLAVGEREMTVFVFFLFRIEDELRFKPPLWLDSVQAYVRHLLLLIERLSQAAPPPQKESPIIRELHQWLDAHCREPVAVPALARRFGFSTDYLTRIFKRGTGMGLKHYVLWRRIVEAQHQLEAAPALKVQAVSESVGFESVTLFNRAFKLFVGTTPSLYRVLLESRRPPVTGRISENA